MDTVVLGDRLPEATQQPLLGPCTLSAVPSSRELEIASRLAAVSDWWDAVTVSRVSFSGVVGGRGGGGGVSSSSIRREFKGEMNRGNRTESL